MIFRFTRHYKMMQGRRSRESGGCPKTRSHTSQYNKLLPLKHKLAFSNLLAKYKTLCNFIIYYFYPKKLHQSHPWSWMSEQLVESRAASYHSLSHSSKHFSPVVICPQSSQSTFIRTSFAGTWLGVALLRLRLQLRYSRPATVN